MKYFCDVHIQSRKDAERRIFIVLENKGNIIPNPELFTEHYSSVN